MTDGAHLGVSASRALETVLGGKPQPAAGERMSWDDMAAWVRSAPETMPDDAGGGDGYGLSARIAARCILEHMEAHPADRASSPTGEWTAEEQAEFRRSGAVPAPKRDWYAATKETHPQIADLGLTGFQVGWAVNAARNILGLGPVRNPAILTIGDDGD
jgi:hypothetical protein